MNATISLEKRVINGVKCGYHATISGTTYNVVKNRKGAGWNVIECGKDGAASLRISTGCRNLEEACEAIAENEGL